MASLARNSLLDPSTVGSTAAVAAAAMSARKLNQPVDDGGSAHFEGRAGWSTQREGRAQVEQLAS